MYSVWCITPPLVASHWRYCAPMCPPCIHLYMPFQYNIRAIALVSCGHHTTWPTMSFLHCDSAYFLASVLSRSMSLYSRCCCLVNQLCRTCCVRVSMRCSRWSWLSFSWSASLYLWIILGSLHFKHLACSGTDSGTLNHPNATSGTSIQMALWSLGMPLPKAR